MRVLQLEVGAWDAPRPPGKIAASVRGRGRVIERVETPCDECVHRHRCAARQLACSAFISYAAGAQWREKSRIPSRARFARLADGSE